MRGLPGRAQGVGRDENFSRPIRLLLLAFHHHHGLQCALFAKGKVESGVGHAQKTPLKGLRFESLEEAQVKLGATRGRSNRYQEFP